MSPKKRAQLLIIFSELYPEPQSELNFVSPYQLLIAVMLSAQCTDKKVNQITPVLFAKYPDFTALAKARFSSISKIIRPINYYRTKAKHLIAAAKLVVEKHAGCLPRSVDELRTLPGVGQKTCNVIVGELKIAHALPVDTHVMRVSKRLGLASGNTPEKVEEELKASFKPELWRNLHHWLIFHGRRVCKARKPECAGCKIRSICRYPKM